MIYKGFEIMLERQTCEFFDLDDDGEVTDYCCDCHDSSHQGPGAEYVAFSTPSGERFIGASDLESLKAYIDKVYADAEGKLAKEVAMVKARAAKRKPKSKETKR